MRRKYLVLVLGYFILLGWPTGTHANGDPGHRRFALVLDFSTCTTASPGYPTTPLICSLFEPNGKPAGKITVTQIPGSFQGADPTRTSQWHDSWEYRLAGGTFTVADSSNWEVEALALVPDPDRAIATPAFIGFGKGDVTGGTGRFAHATGTITMRWDGVFCICLIDLVL
jgi:hypothetical protein